MYYAPNVIREVDVSKMTTLQSCPRNYLNQYALGKNENSIHLVFGSAYHEGLDYLHRSWDVEEAVFHAQQMFTEKFDPEFAPEPYKTRDSLATYLQGYHDQYKNSYELIASELPAVYITESGIPIHMNIDRVVKMRNGIYALEAKTTKFNTARDFSKWQMHLQPQAYSLFIAESFENVRGTLMDITVTQKLAKYHLEFVALTPQNKKVWVKELDYWATQAAQWNEHIINHIDKGEELNVPRSGAACAFAFGCKHGNFCTNQDVSQYRDYHYKIWSPSAREEVLVTWDYSEAFTTHRESNLEV